jgi:hypothetical protein
VDTITIAEIEALLQLIAKVVGRQALAQLLARVDADGPGFSRRSAPECKSAEAVIAGVGSLPPMLVDNLLPDNSLFLLTGKPKTGKSFLALDVADSISHGSPVFQSLNVNRPGPVLYLAMEDGQIELARRLTQRRHQKPGTSSLFFITEPINLTDPLAFAQFKEQVAQLNPVLIVIDTAAEALDIRDWINRSEIIAKIAPLRRLARETCSVLLVAHNRKAEGDGGDEIAGSNALAAAVDGWISAHRVERRPNGNRRLFLRIEGRGGVGHELIVEMDHETLHFSRIYEEQVESEGAAARAASYSQKRLARRKSVSAAIENFGGRATITEIAARLGLCYKSAWLLVREMAADAEVEEIPESRPDKRKAPAYRIRLA